MKKSTFRAQASSTRAADAAFGGFGGFATATSPLSYITEQPDLSLIQRPNVVVALKNVAKKDSTTKQKALEELLVLLDDHADSAAISAWCDIYPRTSIDNSQTVRRTAHVLTGSLVTRTGKDIVPFLPKIIPSWLAGTFDNDKTVAKAASDALDKTFATPEKRRTLWKIYAEPLQERIDDALTAQTTSTLSDERTTSPDEAQAKYVRVVGTALRLLDRLTAQGLGKNEIFEGRKIWDFIQHEDAYVRTGILQLLITVTDQDDILRTLDPKGLSTALIAKSLNSSQTGSISLFLRSLIVISKKLPNIWTSDYNAKTPAVKRLQQLLQKGSQNGPQEVWKMLVDLLRTTPKGLIMAGDYNDVIAALRNGVCQERLHVISAWTSYIEACKWAMENLGNGDYTFAQSNIAPIILVYVRGSVDEKWRISTRDTTIVTAATALVQHFNPGLMSEVLQQAVDDTIEKMRLSLPESSKDFKKSQDMVGAQGMRFVAVQKSLSLEKSSTNDSLTDNNNTGISLAQAATDLLRSRNGKPYGAAIILETLLRNDLVNTIEVGSFVSEVLPQILDSPSCSQLVSIAQICGQSTSAAILNSESSSKYIEDGVLRIIQTGNEDEFADKKLSDAVLTKVGYFKTEQERKYALAALNNEMLGHTYLASEITSRILAGLSDKDLHAGTLTLLKQGLSSPTAKKHLSAPDFRSQATSKLLFASDDQPEIADEISVILKQLDGTTDSATGTVSVIKAQLAGSTEYLSILTVVDLASELVSKVSMTDLLPQAADWENALAPHLKGHTSHELTITSPLQGAIYSITNSDDNTMMAIPRDKEEFSLLFRLAFYTTKLLRDHKDLLGEDSPPITALHQYLPLALQLVNEKITLDDANGIWLGSTDEVIQAAADVLSDGRALMSKFVANPGFVTMWLGIGHGLAEADRTTYIQASAFVSVCTQTLEQDSSQVVSAYDSDLQNLHKSTRTIQSSALAALFGAQIANSQSGLRITNELVAKISQSPGQLASLVLLNILLVNASQTLHKVPQPRLVALFRSLVSQISTSGASAVSTECLKLARSIMTYIQDIYDDAWGLLIQALSEILAETKFDNIPLLNASLRVYAELKKLSGMDEANDDLKEGMKTAEKLFDEALISCLSKFSSSGGIIDQPRTITAELFRRQTSSIITTDTSSLWSGLSSTESAIQNATYDVLHRSIPARQEQISIDVALDNQPIHLPTELLQLVVDQDDIRRYMLSWKVVFDHFTNASHKLAAMYTEDIKDSHYLNQLLIICCERFGILSGRPIDASKIDVPEYELDRAETEDFDTRWLSIHIFYLCLRHLPGLTKAWFLEQKNNIKTPLEAWTQKYISPYIITASVLTIEEWAQTQDRNDRPVEIKASSKNGEIVASIKVDPESPPISMSISLPASYPLNSPAVTARERVGVSEKNFTSWLRTIQIIIFSSGSVIEGIVALRRNVQGALKGQTECAICYSIIGTDMQTPNKKCATCKNIFHGTCLYRWFKSSSSSSCPLCRNNFSYA